MPRCVLVSLLQRSPGTGYCGDERGSVARTGGCECVLDAACRINGVLSVNQGVSRPVFVRAPAEEEEGGVRGGLSKSPNCALPLFPRAVTLSLHRLSSLVSHTQETQH